MKVKYSYLETQFAEVEDTLAAIRTLAQSGDFTLGAAVSEFEDRFAAFHGAAYAIGVNSGTDAIALSLKALAIESGDEVITAPNTFIGTVGAIVQVGARPVFVDVGPDYNIDPDLIEGAITSRTKAVVPVHLCGRPADMPPIAESARRRNLHVIEDAAQAIDAALDGRPVGNFGVTGCFSLHPLKNLNVWGDGGVITTNSRTTRDQLKVLRNHGLTTRDNAEVFGLNSRLDSLQAVVALSLIDHTKEITEARIGNAARYDAGLADLSDFVTVPPRDPRIREVYHMYVIQARDRDRLVSYLLKEGVQAKIHYPTPVHLQPAARHLGYRPGDFPVAEAQSRAILSLPTHQYLRPEQIEYVVECIRRFYGR